MTTFKMNRLWRNMLFFAPLLLLFAGCTKEEISGRSIAGGSMSVLLRPDPVKQVTVKSIAAGVDESSIINVCAIQLDGDGNVVTGSAGAPLITSYPYNDPDGKGTITPAPDNLGGSIYIRADAQTSEVLFIANTAGVDFSNVKNKSDIAALVKSISNEESLVTNYNNANYLPMTGIWRPQAGGSNEVEMTRAVAKLEINLAFGSETAGDAFALSSIQVRQVANTMQYYRDPATIDIYPYPALTATTDYAVLLYDGSQNSLDGYSDLETEWGAFYMPAGDKCYGKILSAAEKFSWYLPENARGIGSAANQWEKNADSAPNGEAEYCTYLEIKGFYLTDGLVEEVVYNVYIGQNNTDDFNILRNRHYIMNVTVKDKDLVDTRVEEYTPQNYIDYTDNDSPWFVVASRGDGAADWQNPTVSQGWSIPTKAQMMVAYAYNYTDIFGTNILWLNEYNSTTRWSINMEIGEILPNDGSVGDVQSYQARAVKSYNGSDRYPYVQDGNIIVSRDENGGVKSDYIREGQWSPGENYNEQSADNKVAAKFEVAPFTVDDSGNWIRRTWNEAKEYCENYTDPEDGSGGWRMPTQRELMLIYAINGELDENYRFKTTGGMNYPGEPSVEHPELAQHIYYWTGTTDGTQGNVNNAWSVCFCNDEQLERGALSGKTEGYGKTEYNFVRPVRDVE